VLIVRSASEILDEIRRIKKLESDAALGEIFGVKQSTVASWRSRSSLPYEDIIAFCVNEGLSTDNLFFIQGPVKISASLENKFGQFTRSFEVDDLFATRITKELRGRTVEWLSVESHVNKQRIDNFILGKVIPTVEEFESIADALNVSASWLAERSKSPSENWMYEFYRKDSIGFFPAEIYKLYLVAAENFIDKMQGLIRLSPELKADVINTACRVHMKEMPDSKEVNPELIRYLLTLAR